MPQGSKKKKTPGHRFKNGMYVQPGHEKGQLAYLRISAGPMRGKYVHIVVMEAKLGRPLQPGEFVDHKDGNGLNPHPDNLEVVTLAENNRRMARRRYPKYEETDPTSGKADSDTGGIQETPVEEVREPGGSLC